MPDRPDTRAPDTRAVDTRAPDTRAVDHVLATTRAVRRRLDLTRPVDESLLLECIELAEQAPTGGGIQSRRWIVVRDPRTRAALAEIYRAAGGQALIDHVESVRAEGGEPDPVAASAAHLARHLEEVPVLVVVCIHGTHDGSGRPGLFDSVLQAAWSFCLAARARGLGTAWTTLHLQRREEAAELLRIPDGITQVVLLPVAHTIGDDFRPARRRPVRDIVYFDRWGYLNEYPSDGTPSLAVGPGVVVERDIEAPAARVWELVTDVGLPARFSEELQEARWLDEPGLGARIEGRNRHPNIGEWTTVSHVTAWEPERLFGWAVSDPHEPGARWRFELERLSGRRTRLRFVMQVGPGPSGLTAAVEAMPDREAAIVSGRRREHAANMTRVVDGIRELAESAPA